MASRIFAALILVAGVGILGVVALGSTDTEEVVSASDSSSAPAETQAVAETESGAAAPAETTTTAPEIPEPENYGPRLDLVNLDGWLNTDITDLDELDGKVVVVELWTYGCFNCQNRVPHTQELYARTSRDDLEIVGVHAPEFEFEKDVNGIVNAAADLGVTWPIALDTEKENFRAWQEGGRRFWPRTYVIDQNGDIRFDHIGEGQYDALDETVDYLLANPPEPQA